jgi:hypothetical protein
MIFAGLSVATREYRTTAATSQECWVTQVVRWSGPAAAVVRVKTSADVIVAVPRELPPRRALGLAKLVLDDREYAELSRKIRPTPWRDAGDHSRLAPVTPHRH